MNARRRESLEVALRRTLGFHLGAADGDADQNGEEHDDWEVLVCALLDAAEEGTLTDEAAVGREFEDYLPEVALLLGESASSRQAHSPALSGQQQQLEKEGEGGEIELYEDVLRDALKHFPLEVTREETGDVGDEDDFVEPGCCLLCERHMPLTRHHVMPKSTHKRYRKKGYTDSVLNRTIAICRPCHSAVHRTHDALTLAERFTTPEQLLADEDIGRFVAWARKQRTTSVEDSRNNLLHYRR